MATNELMPVAQALEAVLREARRAPRTQERVPLAAAAGRVLALDHRAPWAIPRAPTSIKDGYAVRSAAMAERGAGSTWKVAGAIFAGASAPDTMPADTVVYVTTGSVVPAGFDAVVEVEQTRPAGEDQVIINAAKAVAPGQDVRQVGSDVQQGALLVSAGTLIDAAAVGLLATFGVSSVAVFKRPRLGVISTGDELLDAAGDGEERPPAAHQIFDANRPMLVAKASEPSSGPAETVDLGIVRDAPATAPGDGWLESALDDHDLDVLVTSGGVSMGQRDFVRGALERLGTVHVHRMLMKPGKPLVFATVQRAARRVLVFAVPGNPVSSIVTFSLLVVPALRVLAGWRRPCPPSLPVSLAHAVSLDPARPEYHRARLEPRHGVVAARSTGFQRSSALASMAGAEVLLQLPSAAQAGRAVLAEGETVQGLVVGSLRDAQRPAAALRPGAPTSLAATLLGHGWIVLDAEAPTEELDLVVLPAGAALPHNARRLPGVEEALRAATRQAGVVDDLVAVATGGALVVSLAGEPEECVAKLEAAWPLLEAARGQAAR